jgi:hypothetical protein
MIFSSLASNGWLQAANKYAIMLLLIRFVSYRAYFVVTISNFEPASFYHPQHTTGGPLVWKSCWLFLLLLNARPLFSWYRRMSGCQKRAHRWLVGPINPLSRKMLSLRVCSLSRARSLLKHQQHNKKAVFPHNHQSSIHTCVLPSSL